MSRRTRKRIKQIAKWIGGTVVVAIASFAAYQAAMYLKSNRQQQ